jgi:hypothetical protein
MPRPLEYHIYVRSWLSPAATLLSLLGIFLFPASAQINAPPSSVTSPGFGGRPINGAPPSVTSLGPRGTAPNGIPFRPNGDRNIQHRRHHDRDAVYAPYAYAYPLSYPDDPGTAYDDPDPENDDANYQGGPTVFDRRGSGARSYIPPDEDVPAPHAAAAQPESVSSDSEPAPPPTLLVFKDGHQLEVSNYAIVGTTLFDLTPGHPRRNPLADVDLEATRKVNETRGVVFQLPPSLQAN